MAVAAKLSVLVVDDHPVVRHGLRTMLSSTGQIAVVGEAGNATEALAMLASIPVDVALVDVMLPDQTGIELTRQLRPLYPDLGIVILTNYREAHYLRDAFEAGAHAYLLKSSSVDDLLAAIHGAHEGKHGISSELTDQVLQQLGQLARSQAELRFGLVPAEVAILRLMAQGSTNRSIAEQLYLSEASVKRRIADIYRKMNASDRAHAMALAARYGLV